MKRFGARPLADLLDSCLKPALAAQGFAAADIVIAWSEIVGPRLAAHCEPLRLTWPRRIAGPGEDRALPATLTVRVEGAFALDLQHLAPVVIERVNAYYGWGCVGRLSMRQGPVGRDRVERRAVPPLDPEALTASRARVGPVQDDGLREALTRLGAAVLGPRRGDSPA